MPPNTGTKALLDRGQAAHAEYRLTVDREEALAAYESPDWETRCLVGETLAEFTDDESAAILGCLLLDRQDEAVSERTAVALLNRDDPYGVALVLAAYAVCDFEQGNILVWVFNTAMHEGRCDFTKHAKTILSGENQWARFGARNVLEWMGIDPTKL